MKPLPAVLTYEQQMLATATLATLVLVFGGGTLKAGFLKLRALLLSGFAGPRTGLKSWIHVGRIRIRDDARLRHTHIVGATGSGKTVLIEQLLYQDLLRGQGALIIDPKGDREFFERIRSFCAAIGREKDLHLLSASYPTESVRWNPCRLGDVSELQSKFFNSSVYDHSYFAKAVELALLKAFQSLAENHETGFTLDHLSQVLQGMADQSRDETLKGLFFDLNSLALSEWGPLFGCSRTEVPQIRGPEGEVSLLDLTRKNEILFVDLPTEAKKTQSQRIGRMLLQEITLLSGMRKNFPHLRGERPFSVYVDEFDAFATPAFATFLNKGRSSGFMIHLAHQTLSDLNQVSDAFAGQIMGNTNVRFIFRQDDPDDAETWSRFFGTRSVVKTTYQTQDGATTGLSSNRQVQEFRVSPDVIKDLPIGECVVSIKTERLFETLRVPPPETVETLCPKLPTQRGPLSLVVKPTFRRKQGASSREQDRKAPEEVPLHD